MQKRIERTIPPAWEQVREIRDLVAEELAHLPIELKEAAAMTSSELVENAVKYGEAKRARESMFRLAHSANEIRIEATNAVESKKAADDLSARIDEISKNRDAENLYISRLQELLADGSTGSRLGLYRIAFEGGFELEFTSSDDLVTIVAKRRVA